MFYATFSSPNLTTFTGLDAHGLRVIGQEVTATRKDLYCEVASPDRSCHRCGVLVPVHDVKVRHLAHAPMGFTPVKLHIAVRRYRCAECHHVFRDDTRAAAEPRQKLSRGGLAWGLHAVIDNQMSISRVASELGVSWGTANAAILMEGLTRLVNDPHRFDGVEVIGVDEHVWRHTKRGDRFVTVIIDLTPIRDQTGPSRLLDMKPGRSKKVLKTWLAERGDEFRNGVEVVAMDGFTGFKTAAQEELPDAVEVMDPFHTAQLAAEAMDLCRRRVQQATTGHRARKGDALYGINKTLKTGSSLLKPHQEQRLSAAFEAHEAHLPLAVTWGLYQEVVASYRAEDPREGKKIMQALIDKIATGVPAGLTEVRKLGHTFKKRAEDILAYFEHPHTSNGPTEAQNRELEHLRGIGHGFTNLGNYILRSLLHAGGFRSHTHPAL